MKLIKIFIISILTCMSVNAQNATNEIILKNSINAEIEKWCDNVQYIPFSNYADEDSIILKDMRFVVDTNKNYALNNVKILDIAQDYDIYARSVKALNIKYNKNTVDRLFAEMTALTDRMVDDEKGKNENKKKELNGIQAKLKYYDDAVEMFQEIIEAVKGSGNNWRNIQYTIKQYEDADYINVINKYEWLEKKYADYERNLSKAYKNKDAIAKQELIRIEKEITNIRTK